MGLAGAGWTFVEAAALRLLGGLRGVSVSVRQARARRVARVARQLCLLVPQTLAPSSACAKKCRVGALCAT
jgi:hypothetical protein